MFEDSFGNKGKSQDFTKKNFVDKKNEFNFSSYINILKENSIKFAEIYIRRINEERNQRDLYFRNNKGNIKETNYDEGKINNIIKF